MSRPVPIRAVPAPSGPSAEVPGPEAVRSSLERLLARRAVQRGRRAERRDRPWDRDGAAPIRSVVDPRDIYLA